MLGCTQAADQKLERRAQPRISRPFPTRICGITAGGEAFEIDSVLDNLSANGGYLRIRQRMKCGAKVFLRVHLCSTGELGPTVDIQGVIVRVEPQGEGLFGVAVSFSQHRLP